MLSQPAVTIGNVGQLAIDLLISTAQLQLVGHLESQHVLPCFGVDAFVSGGGPTTALELFLDADRQVLVLQQRSPVVTGCQRRFADEFLGWVQRSGMRKVGGCACSLGCLIPRLSCACAWWVMSFLPFCCANLVLRPQTSPG